MNRDPGRGAGPPAHDDAELLRRALHAEADAVDPSADGLRVIRQRIAAGEGAPRRRYRLPLAVAAVAAGAVVVAGVATALDRDRAVAPSPAPPAGPAPSVTTAPVPSTDAATPSPDPGSATSSASLSGVPVYALTMAGTDARIVREFRQIPARGDRVTSAVSALALEPVDPDYTTFWRRPSRLSVDVRGDRIVVDLSPDAFADQDVGSGDLPSVAVQQLVWTATAAAGRDVPVTVLVDGRRGYDAWGGVVLGSPMRRDVAHRAPVWVDTPPDGGALPAGTQHVTGQGSGFEATFRYRVTAGSREVTSGFVTGVPAGASYGWWTFDIALRLPRGTYTVTVTADNPATGEEAGPAWPDTKRFTVP
jgi:hypothetical protein